MTSLPDYLTPEIWLDNVFAAAQARRGGVLKRQVRDVERICGLDLFLSEARKRGFQILRNGRHFIIICNAAPVFRVL